MSAQSPTLAELLDAALTRRLGEVHTALPGRIESFDASKQVADVQPLVQARALQEDGTYLALTLPVLPGIPVAFPGGGGFRATYPVAQGDGCLIVFSEASLDAWQARGGVTDPADGRRHHLADAVCLVGLHDNTKPWKGAATDAATWGKDGGPQVVARSGGIELGADAAHPPTDKAVLGTTYRKAEDTFLQQLGASMDAIAGALQAASVALATAASANTTPIVGGGLAAPSFATVVSQLAAAAAQATAVKAAATAYKSTGAEAYLSGKVKVAT